MDTFDALEEKWFSRGDCESTSGTGVPSSPFRRVIMFVDNAGISNIPHTLQKPWLQSNIRVNRHYQHTPPHLNKFNIYHQSAYVADSFKVAGADIVLGMIPFAREFLRMGAEVVMVANSQPAINDITSAELRRLLEDVSTVCPVIQVSRLLAEQASSLMGCSEKTVIAC